MRRDFDPDAVDSGRDGGSFINARSRSYGESPSATGASGGWEAPGEREFAVTVGSSDVGDMPTKLDSSNQAAQHRFHKLWTTGVAVDSSTRMSTLSGRIPPDIRRLVELLVTNR